MNLIKIIKSSQFKEVFLYVLFGGLTTLISLLSFTVLCDALRFNEHVANVISWVLAVSFAFITNKIWVFKSSQSSFIKQMLEFYAGRLLTLGVEEVLIFVFISLLSFNAFAVKFSAQFVVLVLNFFISKFFVFKTE